MGRPTKIEGNPDHPASLGACGVHGQAEILQLYDPDRSQTVSLRGEIRSWGAFNAALLAALSAQKALAGEGLRILTETVSSPSLAAQLQEVLAAYPKARWHQYESASRDEVRAGALRAFGEPLDVRYRLDAADVVLCLDADLVGTGPGHLRYVRELTRRRRPSASEGMNRIYAVESAVTPTGGIADHRLPLRPSEIEVFARALAAQLGLAVAGGEDVAPGPHGAWLQAVARDLDNLPSDDEEAIAQLVRIKGIGRWSAEIYLLFAEGRADIWPAGDLAVQAGLGKILGHDERPSEKRVRELAEPWRPHRGAVAILTWHCYNNAAL
jgi:molybdopterin-containing oxidoreductase family iron-sulfur binding subunit